MKYVKFLLVFSLLAVIVPNLVSAATSAEIQAQIQSLIQQIQQLQAQLTQLQGTTQWCHTFNVNLKIGDSGVDVAALYAAMNKEGFETQDTNYAQEKAQNYFGEGLASAVTGFQQKYASEILTPLGLKYGTGFVGKSTRAKLNKLYGCGGQVCAQVMTPAKNPQTGDCKIFSTPCDVPSSWQKVESCVTLPACLPLPECLEGYTPYDTGERDANGCSIRKCIPRTQNQPPTISGVSGPTTLKVNETGTWTVQASDPEQGVLSYSVRWGDEGMTSTYSAAQRPSFYAQAATFTHSYASAGNYNPTFTVTDNQGLSAKTSISVNVGEITKETGDIKITVSYCPLAICGSTATGGSCGVSSCLILTNAEVSVYDEKGNFIGTKNTSGGTAAFYNLPVGVYTAVASASGYEKSKSDFKITANTGGYLTINLVKSAVTSSITVLSPNGGESWAKGSTQTIRWNTTGNISRVSILLVPVNYSVGANTFAANVANTGSYSWTIPNCTANVPCSSNFEILTGNYYIRVYDPTTSVSDESDAPFSIVAAGTLLPDFSATNISFNPNPAIAGKETIMSFDVVNKGTAASTGSGVPWDIELSTTDYTKRIIKDSCSLGTLYVGSSCRVELGLIFPNPSISISGAVRVDKDNHYPEIDDTNNTTTFRLSVVSQTSPSITVLSPNGGETWQAGSSYEVSWNNPTGKNVRIELLKNTNYITSWGPLQATMVAYRITLAASLQSGSDYKIRITSLDANNAADYKYYDDSDAPFSIVVASNVLKLDVSAINTGNYTTIAGSSGFIFGRYKFDAGQSSENIQITSIPIGYAVASGLATGLTSCSLYDGSTALSSGVYAVNPTNQVIYNFYLHTVLVIPKGTSKIVDLKCDVTSNAGGSSYQWTIDKNISATGVTSNNVAQINLTTNTIGTIRIVASGSFSVELDSSSPVAKTVAAGTTGVTATVLKFSASDEDISLQQLGFRFDGSNQYAVGQFTVWDGSTRLGSGVVFSSGNVTAILHISPSLIIPKNSSKILTIKVDLVNLGGTVQPVVAGDTVAINYDGINWQNTKGIGQSSGITIYSSTKTNTSAPKITIVAAGTSGGGGGASGSVENSKLEQMASVLQGIQAVIDELARMRR